MSMLTMAVLAVVQGFSVASAFPKYTDGHRPVPSTGHRWSPTKSHNRTALFWLVPYGNLTSQADYEQAWAQFGSNARPEYVMAGSAYAAKPNGSLGYATTPAGEANYGIYMELYGFPALKKMGLTTIGMVYVTHFEAIAKIVADPEPFIASLVAKANTIGLDGFDIDYEPQGVVAAGVSAGDFQDFLNKLAVAMQKNKLLLTIDVGGCPEFNAFKCSDVPDGLDQVNTMSTFGSRSVQDFKMYAGSDATALGEKWAPGFEPANPGQSAFGPILKAAAEMGAQRIATWEVHECNVGPQPQWLFDAVNDFLDLK